MELLEHRAAQKGGKRREITQNIDRSSSCQVAPLKDREEILRKL
jgi:hypothetical protein